MRLFLAIDPPPALRSRIDWWRSGRFPGTPVASRNLHITLVFLGEIPDDRLDSIREVAGYCNFTPFELHLDRIGRWQNGILYLAPSTIPPPLLALQQSLQEGVRALGIPVETRRYSPHLTLSRGTPYIERLGRCPTFVWPVDNFRLFSSESTEHGGQWYREMDVFLPWTAPSTDGSHSVKQSTEGIVGSGDRASPDE